MTLDHSLLAHGPGGAVGETLLVASIAVVFAVLWLREWRPGRREES